MIVVWTPEAQRDRANIWDYIAADNPGAAVRVDELFSEAAARLAVHPKMGGAEKSAKRPFTDSKNACTYP